MAEVDQVPGAELGAADLIHPDGPVGLGLVALDHHHGHSGELLSSGRLERGVGRRDQHDAFDALVAQVVDRVGELLAGQLLEVGRADEVARLAAGCLDRAVHGARTPVAALGPDHADGGRAPGDQGARRRVGSIAELLDRLQHPLAGLGSQVALAVDHP